MGVEISAWNMLALTLGCLLDIHIEKSNGQLDTRVLGTVEVNLVVVEIYRYLKL